MKILMCRLWCCPLSCHLGSEIGPALQEEHPTLSSWQSFTYCNCDKIKLPSSMDLHSYNPWKIEYTSLEQLTATSHSDIDLRPTTLKTLRRWSATVQSNSVRTNALNLHCESLFGRMVVTGLSVTLSLHCWVSLACFPARVWLARLLLSATAHEWRCGI